MAGHNIGRLVVAAVGAGAAALLVVLAVALASGVGDSPFGETEASFSEAHDFQLPTFEGDTFVLSAHGDGPVFLYFWASWCAPCRDEAPVIEALWPEYAERGYTFLGINIWDREADAQAFVDEFGLTFPLARDVEGAAYLDYGVQGLPEAYFLRPGLEVDAKFIGPLTEPELRQMLERLADS